MQDNMNKTKSQWVYPLFCSLLFSFTFCVFAPIELYFSNAGEFWFGVGDLIAGIVIVFLTAWAMLFGLCMLLRGKGRGITCAIIFGLAVMMYLQGNFLNPSYGVLNGESIDWSRYTGYAVWNTALWVLVPVLCVFFVLWKNRAFVGASRFVCVVLTLMQLVTLVTVSLETPKEKKTNYCFTKKDEFNLSAKQNIVFFILDTVDTSTVQDMLAKDRTFFSPLDGFVMYPNSVCAYPVTKFAVPYLLTSTPYLFETSYGSYLESSWKAETFFHALKNNGYSIRLYTESDFALSDMNEVVDNMDLEQPVPTSAAALCAMMYRFAGFRYAPHLFKPSLWFYSDGFNALRTQKEGSVYVADDALFLSELKQNGIQCTTQTPVFTFYHLEGAHVPNTLQADGTRTPNGEVVSIDDQLHAVFGGVFSILQQMKDQGVYNNSTIVITADHGNIVLDHSPILMIKARQATGALQTNPALATQQDLHQTMLSDAGIDKQLSYGENLLSLPEDTYREGTHYDFRWTDGDVFTEYNVALDQTGKALYMRSGLQYKPDGVYEVNTPELAIDQYIKTAKIADLSTFVDEICTYFEEEKNGGVELDGPWQHFQWQLPADAEYTNLLVRFDLSDVTNGAQRVQVLCGTDLIDTIQLHEGDSELRLTIPGDSIEDGLVSFTLRFPDAISAYTLSGDKDVAHYPRNAICIAGFTTEAN